MKLNVTPITGSPKEELMREKGRVTGEGIMAATVMIMPAIMVAEEIRINSPE